MEVRPGYKQTDVGVIPDEWDAVELDAVCSMKSGEGITAASINQFSQYPCYGGNGLRGYTSRFTHDGTFALVGRQGALCGNVVSAEGRFFASEHAVVVTAKSGTDIRFLTYVLGEMRLNRFSESSAQPGLSVSKVLRLLLAIPSTEAEQRSIATALRDMDALLDGLDRLIAKKRDLKQAAMQQLLTGQTRLPGFQGNWEVVEFGDVATIRNTKVLASAAPAGAQCVELESIGQGSGRLLMSTGASGLSTKYSFKKGDVLFGRLRAYLRKYWLATFDGVCSTEIWPLVAQDEGLYGGFLHLLVQTNDFVNAAGVSYGTHMPRSDWSVLKKFQVQLPPGPEQTAIVAVLSDMDAELSVLEARRDKTRDLKEAMMQELLTGKTRLIPVGGAHG